MHPHILLWCNLENFYVIYVLQGEKKILFRSPCEQLDPFNEFRECIQHSDVHNPFFKRIVITSPVPCKRCWRGARIELESSAEHEIMEDAWCDDDSIVFHPPHLHSLFHSCIHGGPCSLMKRTWKREPDPFLPFHNTIMDLTQQNRIIIMNEVAEEEDEGRSFIPRLGFHDQMLSCVHFTHSEFSRRKRRRRMVKGKADYGRCVGRRRR